MNKRNRIAVILLVIAIILSMISIMIRIGINSVDESPKEETPREHSAVQGTVQLIVEKPGVEINEVG